MKLETEIFINHKDCWTEANYLKAETGDHTPGEMKIISKDCDSQGYRCWNLKCQDCGTVIVVSVTDWRDSIES